MKRLKVDIIIPVYNEENKLEICINKLRMFLKNNRFPYNYQIVIANNASTDSTLEIAKKLSKTYKEVDYIHLDKKGRGRALRKAWLQSKADIVSYMDVDLSTGLEAFPKMINAVAHGYDISTGTRLVKKSKTDRSIKREILSIGYNLFLKSIIFNKFSDAQCGFKAVRKDVVNKIVPMIKSNEWFFDTELLTLGEKKGYKIKEIPITWEENSDSRVHIIGTVWEYIRNVLRLRIDLLKKGLL